MHQCCSVTHREPHLGSSLLRARQAPAHQSLVGSLWDHPVPPNTLTQQGTAVMEPHRESTRKAQEVSSPSPSCRASSSPGPAPAAPVQHR